MSFQVPRRDHFPRPLGDNSPHTPPDPESGPVYKKPVLGDYVEARERWVRTGDMMALWEMEDNVAAVPAGWGEPDPRPPAPVINQSSAVPTTVSRWAYTRQVAFGFLVTVSILWTTIYWLVIR